MIPWLEDYVLNRILSDGLTAVAMLTIAVILYLAHHWPELEPSPLMAKRKAVEQQIEQPIRSFPDEVTSIDMRVAD